MHSKLKGNIGQNAVVLALSKCGFNIFSELGDLSKIDLIVELNQKLIKIQVKAATPKNGVISLYLKKSGPNYQFKYHQDDCDFFALVNLLTFEVALINSKILLSHDTSLILRLEKTINNQTKNIRYFKDFTNIEKILRDYTHNIQNG